MMFEKIELPDQISADWARAWEAFQRIDAAERQWKRDIYEPAAERVDRIAGHRPAVDASRDQLDEFKARHRAAEEETGWSAIQARDDELMTAFRGAQRDLIVTRTPTLAALASKLEVMIARDPEDSAELVQLLADVRELECRPAMPADLQRRRDTDPATHAAEALAGVQAEWTGDDDDGEENWARWSAKDDAAVRDLVNAPARTGRGLAAKLRVALERDGTDDAAVLFRQVIEQLEAA